MKEKDVVTAVKYDITINVENWPASVCGHGQNSGYGKKEIKHRIHLFLSLCSWLDLNVTEWRKCEFMCSVFIHGLYMHISLSIRATLRVRIINFKIKQVHRDLRRLPILIYSTFLPRFLYFISFLLLWTFLLVCLSIIW